MKKKLILLIICVLILAGCYLGKPCLAEATLNEIADVDGIGLFLAKDIKEYVILNPNYVIHDLLNVDYIGEVRLDKLKKHFR